MDRGDWSPRPLPSVKAVIPISSSFQQDAWEIKCKLAKKKIKQTCLLELDYKEGWVLKNWGFCTVVLEKTLDSPLDCKAIKPVSPKGNQLWIFVGRTNAEDEATMATWWEELIHWKRLWCWERLRGGGEGDARGWDGWMASWTQWTWVWEKSGRQWRRGSLLCCSPWGRKKSDTNDLAVVQQLSKSALSFLQRHKWLTMS